MIKLNRQDRPSALTEELQETLTKKYKETRESVWNIKFLKDALLQMSNNKCCYCETKLGQEGKYLEVEHFKDKESHPDEVINWENLLPSCKRCNVNKGTHDTILEPIINPTIDNPTSHMILRLYRFKGIDDIGKNTIDILYLNDTDKIVRPRFEIGEQTQKTLESLLEKANEYNNGTNNSTRRKNIIVNGTKELLREALPISEYGATVATILIYDSNYALLKDILIQNGLWDDELESLEQEANSICFHI